MKRNIVKLLSLLFPLASFAQTNTFPTTGNVGIGTTSPNAKLEVRGTPGTLQFLVQPVSTGNAFAKIAGNGNAHAYLSIDANYAGYIDFLSAGTSKWQIGRPSGTYDFELFNSNLNSTSMSVQSSTGNVGIGTSTPVTKLHLQGTFFVDNTSTNQICLQNNGTYYGSIFTPGAAKWSLGYTGDRQALGASVLTWTDAGNIGIGTTTPVAKLHLQGTFFADNTSTNQICLQNNGNYYGSIFTPGTAKWSLGFTGDRQALGTSVLTWTDQGNVLIGTTSLPATDAKLAVDGNIYSRKVKVTQTGWADYVFHPTYRLRPLSEVEQYIKQYQHLPEVPSAADIEKNGIDLGDNQALLLKKIEELTLYLIEVNAKVEQLQRENLELKKRMDNPDK